MVNFTWTKRGPYKRDRLYLYSENVPRGVVPRRGDMIFLPMMVMVGGWIDVQLTEFPPPPPSLPPLIAKSGGDGVVRHKKEL